MSTKIQEIFNTVADHLLTQKVQSREYPSGVCLYRGSNGTKCAVGCLIKDEYFVERFNALPADERCVEEAVCLSLGFDLPERGMSLLKDLQRVHDQQKPEEWPHSLNLLATAYNLNPSPLMKEAAKCPA